MKDLNHMVYISKVLVYDIIGVPLKHYEEQKLTPEQCEISYTTYPYHMGYYEISLGQSVIGGMDQIQHFWLK